MADELKIWALDEEGDAKAVESVSGMKLEDILEDTLVRRPEMLENGIHLVGRQTPTDGGPSDLLGIDSGGRLVVFELKRGKTTREAVTQCIDYASALSAKEPEELGELIAEHSGTGGIEEVEDFEEWYIDRFADNELSDLLPPRLVLVGVGVDERAERMARFLRDGGIDISVLTFYGFEHEGETLLARQVEVEQSTSAKPRSQRLSPAEREERAQRLLQEQGLTDLFDSVCEALQRALPSLNPVPAKMGRIFYLSGRGGRFCSLFAGYPAISAGLALSLPAKAHSDESLLADLRSGIELHPWQHGGFAIAIANLPHWEEQQAEILGYLRAAAESWLDDPAGSINTRLREFIGSIPSGRVVTYGQVASHVGSAAQAVGSWISALPEDTDLPWWRVVNSAGGISYDDPERPEWQQNLLADDGVSVNADGRVDLDKYQWSG
ncbi:MAG: DUF91 domain-containing protein [Dehalococcoidia bacterium]|nr:DUF91 domain-containing protein [Dehalococcoidia bacterium]